MKHHRRLALAGLLTAVALTVAACGAVGGDPGEPGEGGTGGDAAAQRENGSGGMASGTQMGDGGYSDERFIDAMVPHHQGAVEMAEVALRNAEHEETRRLAEDIVATQEAEIEELKEIKEEEFGTSRVPMDMGPDEMGNMGMMEDPQSLAEEEPFDRAFIEAMIPHHRSAIQMANAALDKSGNPRVRELAGGIVEAQEREISQMRAWREDWYPQG